MQGFHYKERVMKTVDPNVSLIRYGSIMKVFDDKIYSIMKGFVYKDCSVMKSLVHRNCGMEGFMINKVVL